MFNITLKNLIIGVAILSFLSHHNSLTSEREQKKKASASWTTKKLPAINQDEIEAILKKMDEWYKKAFPDEPVAEEQPVESPRQKQRAQPPSIDEMLKELNNVLAHHKDKIPSEITFLISEAYRISYQEELIDHTTEEDEDNYLYWCTCHPRSLRIALLIKVIVELTQRFPDRNQEITAVILAPGSLLQEYVLGYLLIHVLGYERVQFHCIDLFYNDPQLDPLSFRMDTSGNVIGPRFKKLTSDKDREIITKMTELSSSLQSLESQLGGQSPAPQPTEQPSKISFDQEESQKKLKMSRKKALEKYITSEKPLKRLVTLLDTPFFTLEYFRHSYSYLTWAKAREIKAQVVLMVDPFPVGSAFFKYTPEQEKLFETLTKEESFASTYPGSNNVLLYGIRRKFDFEISPAIAIRYHTYDAPTIMYAQKMYINKDELIFETQELTENYKKNKTLIDKLQKIVNTYANEPTPWSDIYRVLYNALATLTVKKIGKKIKRRIKATLPQDYAALACDPYIAFEDIAQALGIDNSIIYWTFNISPILEGEKEIYPGKIYAQAYERDKERKRLQAGNVIPEIDTYLKNHGYVKVTQ